MKIVGIVRHVLCVTRRAYRPGQATLSRPREGSPWLDKWSSVLTSPGCDEYEPSDTPDAGTQTENSGGYLGCVLVLIGVGLYILWDAARSLAAVFRMDWRLVAVGAPNALLLTLAFVLGRRKERQEVVGFFMGLGTGGLVWIWVLLLTVGVDEQLQRLQEHAFDVIGASGLAAFTFYFARSEDPLVRVLWAVPIYMLIGGLTAFSYKGGLGAVLLGVSLGVMEGAIAGFFMRLYDPEWTLQWPTR